MRPTNRQPPGTLAVLASLLLALAASAFWLLVPAVASVSGGTTTAAPTARPPGVKGVSVMESTTPDGEVLVRETMVDASGRELVREHRRPAPEVHHQTLLESESAPDAQMFALFAFPVALAAFPLALNATRLRTPARSLAAALLTGGSLLAGFSIGLFYLPSALAMTVAAIRRDQGGG